MQRYKYRCALDRGCLTLFLCGISIPLYSTFISVWSWALQENCTTLNIYLIVKVGELAV